MHYNQQIHIWFKLKSLLVTLDFFGRNCDSQGLIFVSAQESWPSPMSLLTIEVNWGVDDQFFSTHAKVDTFLSQTHPNFSIAVHCRDYNSSSNELFIKYFTLFMFLKVMKITKIEELAIFDEKPKFSVENCEI